MKIVEKSWISTTGHDSHDKVAVFISRSLEYRNTQKFQQLCNKCCVKAYTNQSVSIRIMDISIYVKSYFQNIKNCLFLAYIFLILWMFFHCDNSIFRFITEFIEIPVALPQFKIPVTKEKFCLWEFLECLKLEHCVFLIFLLTKIQLFLYFTKLLEKRRCF